ncbi:hypothetical protein G6O69_09090 [Pseudenhygromyxa sp. WMMC2535]|uniref:hypothetical protein n=1 Tax=Pseudenhygromyxa sp. WMMC2535 TaxID=2712867 RepID=UPI001554908A|nr:hypothetical protein [Pseudenhygromyxa sp. WMMC2535]NVB37986.1 hypothetical protein [Pseudenhygromyxa sp. WMMC2535]
MTCRHRFALTSWALAVGSTSALVLGSTPALASPTEPGQLEQPLSTAEACSTCHDFATPDAWAESGGSVDPWAWRGSMMANSARDPVFWAGVALANQDYPGETEDCVRCHSPRAFLEGAGDALALEELGEDQREGVDCDLCHRMIDDGETPAGNARYVLADAPEGEGVPRFGPWSYEGGAEPEHPWGQDLEFLPGARMCGTCHDVSTARERVDDEGVGMGVPFNEQRTYSEWLGSAYAEPGGADQASCQSCHVPAIEGTILGCNMFAGQPHEDGGSRHVLVGANATTLRVLASLYGDAGTGEVADARFEESIAWTEEFARTAASLEVDFPAAVDLGEGLPDLAVTVTNETGHKLPSGYSEGRVMWLELRASYGDAVVWSSGLWDAEALSIEGDEQLRRYEAIAERHSDGTRNHLVLNDHWLVDDRIPPKGLVQDLETDPVGDRYALQADGTWPHFDSHAYSFAPASVDDLTPADANDDQLELRVRLLYLINTPDYLDQLLEDNLSNDAGQRVTDAFDDLGGPQPIVLAEASASVTLTGLLGTGADESGGDELGSEGESSDEVGSEGSGSDETGEPGANASEGCGCASTDPQRGGGWAWAWLFACLGLGARLRLSARSESAV